ncbi:MAG TPA: hypothetical protein VHQ65_07765 [Thermoanaerobaculia bacterium]|nr:hypothetical protein [Thermoanaerobaculia bacterium]
MGTGWAPGFRASAPFGHNGPDSAPETVRCRCGAVRHAENPDRCASGHALPGNGLAVVAGHRSVEFWQAHEAERRELQRLVVEDAGHTLHDAPRALLVAADGLAQAVLIRDSAFARVVDSGGPLTSSGRTRRAFTVWSSAVDRVERHLRLLGLKREPKPGPSLANYMASNGDSGEVAP